MLKTTPPSSPPSPGATGLEDVFGEVSSVHEDGGWDERSDVARLRAVQTTAGYREGVAAAKETTLQPGFDEGYSLGATFGLRIGYLLGLAEGLEELVKGNADLLNRARQQLHVDAIFSPDFFSADGLWTYPVPGKSIVFADVVNAHPIVRSWTEVLDQAVDAAQIRRNVFEGVAWEAGRMEEMPQW